MDINNVLMLIIHVNVDISLQSEQTTTLRYMFEKYLSIMQTS